MAFDPVAEDLVEEDRGGASGENGGTDERIDHRSFEQRSQVLRDSGDGGLYLFVIRKAGCLFSLEAVGGDKVHAIGCFALGDDRDSREAAAVLQLRTLGVHQVL
jgi:hypothetical protein